MPAALIPYADSGMAELAAPAERCFDTIYGTIKSNIEMLKDESSESRANVAGFICDTMLLVFDQFGRAISSGDNMCLAIDTPESDVVKRMYFYASPETRNRYRIWRKALDPIAWFGVLV